MKNMKKLLLTMIAMLSLVFAMQLSASAAIRFDGYEENKVKISWDKPTTYPIEKYEIYRGTATTPAGTLQGTATGATITYSSEKGIVKGIVEKITVRYYYKTSYSTYSNDMYVTVNTKPADMTAKSFSIETGSKSVGVNVKTPEKASKVQVELYSLSGKKVVDLKDAYSYYTKDIVANAGYRVRVRSVYVNPSDQKSYYGDWSAPKYFANTKLAGKSYSDKAGFNLTLKKGKAIRYYMVYVSPKKTSGFKKAMKVTVKGSSKTVHIAKYGSSKLKKRTTYYVKVVPYVAVGSKTVKSQTYAFGSIYVWK